jgi:hypothetical protein
MNISESIGRCQVDTAGGVEVRIQGVGLPGVQVGFPSFAYHRRFAVNRWQQRE